MADIRLKNICKTYENDISVVHDFNLEIKDKEFVVFVGPSGCGKSTTLRMIAGLEEISSGELLIGGKRMNEVAPKDRNIAMVFQSYALYPHKSVYKNMSFALEMKKIPKTEIDRRVREAAKTLDIEQYLNRKPRALSGGQRQRVALGRAMVRNPSVFLLDEPLSNLDAKLRTSMRTEIKKLHNQLETTFVYVTHDQTEAMTMGDRIVVIKDGRIMQADTPREIYHKPQNMFSAGFIGTPRMNFLDASVIKSKKGWSLKLKTDRIDIPESKCPVNIFKYADKEIVLGIRPEDLRDDENYLEKYKNAAIHVPVEAAELMGSEIYLHTRYAGQPVIAKVSPESPASEGDVITLAVNTDKIHLFDKNTEERII